VDIKEMKALIEMVDQSSLNVFALKKGDMELVLKKPTLEEKIVISKEVIHDVDTLEQEHSIADVQQEKTQKQNTVNVLAPLVGVFYQSSSPEAEPFVTVGQMVKKGDTVCIIEAMKILNEIKAPTSGRVAKIYVKNNDVVGFNQILMEIGE